MKHSSTTAKLQFGLPFEARISRLFIFRSLWMCIEVWVWYGWALIMYVVTIVHFLYMLFLGRRHRWMWDMQMRFMRHTIKWQTYLTTLSSGRPKFVED